MKGYHKIDSIDLKKVKIESQKYGLECLFDLENLIDNINYLQKEILKSVKESKLHQSKPSLK